MPAAPSGGKDENCRTAPSTLEGSLGGCGHLVELGWDGQSGEWALMVGHHSGVWKRQQGGDSETQAPNFTRVFVKLHGPGP